MSPENWLHRVGGYEDFDNKNFKWPEAIALATNSVASNQFNPHPSAPRNFSALNDEMIQKKKNNFFVTGALCIMMLS
jgi:hypothetical protein